MTEDTKLETSAPEGARPGGLLRNIFGVLADRRAWGGLGYMLLSLATGIFYFTWVVTGLSLSLGLSLLIFGVPVFLGFVASVRLLSRLERVLVEALLGRPLPRDSAPAPAPAGFLARVKSWLTDSRTWASMLYLVLELPIGIVYFTVVVTLLALSASLFLAPAIQWLAGLPILWIGTTGYWLPLWAAPLASLAGVALLLAAMHLARGLGRVQAALAGQMLVRGRAC